MHTICKFEVSRARHRNVIDEYLPNEQDKKSLCIVRKTVHMQRAMSKALYMSIKEDAKCKQTLREIISKLQCASLTRFIAIVIR